EDRSLGEADAARASELLRRLGQRQEPVVVLQRGEVALAQVAPAAQPEGASLLGEVHPARRPLLPANQGATPAALSPLRRQNPREEPGALAAHAGICAGGEEQSSSLPRPKLRTGLALNLARCNPVPPDLIGALSCDRNQPRVAVNVPRQPLP